MFLNHFGLIEQPFGVTPDPRFLHMGVKHREALASLWYGTDCNRGFMALIAEPGMGKTSLLYQYLEGLRGKARTAFIFQTASDSRDFMRHILGDLGLDHAGKSLPAMHEMLNELLVAEMNAGRRFILVVDEAQNLDEKVLESVRLLSNFETPWMKLMQIVIAGQPELAERLTRPSMAQLRQRISSVIRLKPFTSEEINAYVDHRLWVAGYAGARLFTVGARLGIAKYSRGIPRNINTLCFNAMSVAYGAGAKHIDAKMVQEAAADVDMESLLPKTSKPLRVVIPARTPAPQLPAPAVTPRTLPARPMPLLFQSIRPSPQRRMVPAFAVFCAVMLLATFSWIAWDRGYRFPSFDAVMASPSPERPAEISGPSDAVAHEDDPQANGARAIDPLSENKPTLQAPAPSLDVVQAVPIGVTAPPQPMATTSANSSVVAGMAQDDQILTIVIIAKANLRQLSLQYLGRFDEVVLAEIHTLNPEVGDADHIEIGQRLRLPLYLRASPENKTLALARRPRPEAQGDAR